MIKRGATVLILAAGSGARMGAEVNKIFLPLDGVPLIAHTLRAFDQHPQIKRLILVARAGEEAQLTGILTQMMPKTPWQVVLGGANRAESVSRGLQFVRSRYVLVHDGARPFVDAELICRVLNGTKKGGAIPALSAGEIGQMVAGGKVSPVVLPAGTSLVAAQTPQSFRTQILKKCHRLGGENVTDDASLLEEYGYPVAIVAGCPHNRKMTTPLDLIDGRVES